MLPDGGQHKPAILKLKTVVGEPNAELLKERRARQSMIQRLSGSGRGLQAQNKLRHLLNYSMRNVLEPQPKGSRKSVTGESSSPSRGKKY